MGFTLGTWNVLANGYIRPQYYPRTPPEVLDPVRRVPALVRHAAGLGLDILCLQEVETDIFLALQRGLSAGAYAGMHALKGGRRPDGCATFFRSDRFTLVSNRRVAYGDGSGHVAQVLQFRHEGRRLEILNTHLKWDPPETPRVHQWGYRQVSEALQLWQLQSGRILCGDLNALPASDVVEKLQSAGFDYVHRSYPGVRTSNANGEAKLIDYLFCDQSLRGAARLPMPIDDCTPLPSPDQPSDHLPLLAEFSWRSHSP
jgi:mRNA deadenylase 3'-5' endonuclease subunit Ccr4